ncbi:hypothetical protein AJ78_07420 [Emergomyces pasteurianus Ep9510]|uniref:Uncharacterized protein n=1 Tax=Emergomyces pasteurianus Ep9510 TaxID=1447872 RepID=A0A1J9P7N5_9EURO|nr:hypothetical protein AJ78_07420 [Emergomyces pasteurianus Ep9510]
MGRGLYDTTGVLKPQPPLMRAEITNKGAMTSKKEVIQPNVSQLLQHPKDLRHFHEPYEGRRLPSLTVQPRLTDLRAIINAGTFPNFEQSKYLATASASQLHQHHHSTASHVVTQARSDNSLSNVIASSRLRDQEKLSSSGSPQTMKQDQIPTREQLIHLLVSVFLHAKDSMQASNTLAAADHYFYEKAVRSHLLQNPPMLQTATESAQIWLGTINIDLESGSRRAVEKRRLNSRASERFRQRKKTKVEEMQETIERLTKECDYLRRLCHRLRKSREAEMDSISASSRSRLLTDPYQKHRLSRTSQ